MDVLQTVLMQIFGVTLAQGIAFVLAAFIKIIAAFMVLRISFRVYRYSRQPAALGFLISIFGATCSTLLATEVKYSITKNAVQPNLLEATLILVPSLFLLSAAICLYRLLSHWLQLLARKG